MPRAADHDKTLAIAARLQAGTVWINSRAFGMSYRV